MDAGGRNQRKIFGTSEVIARPKFSPDSRHIVFESKEPGKNLVHITIVDAFGRNPSQIENKEFIDRDPQWTPDGKLILFSSNRNKENGFSIFAVNGAGTCVKQVTTPGKLAFDIYPSLSPDSKKLLYTSNRNGHFHLYLEDWTAPAECITDKK
jgi:Tol biopolymer transport system component